MTQPIYKFWRMRPTEAWYQLSQEEKDSLMGKLSAVFDEVDAEDLVQCTSLWASEEWMYFGIHKYPDLEALQKHYKSLQELNWTRYMESETMIGSEGFS